MTTDDSHGGSGASGTPNPPRCSIASTVAVVGDRWSILVLRSVFRGRHRFGELQSELGIAKNLLSNRLCRLVDEAVLHKVPYQDKPLRYEYRLTAKGADLYQALISLMQWGDQWYADGQPPTVLIHDQCGEPLDLTVRCRRCDTAVRPGEVASRSHLDTEQQSAREQDQPIEGRARVNN